MIFQLKQALDSFQLLEKPQINGMIPQPPLRNNRNKNKKTCQSSQSSVMNVF